MLSGLWLGACSVFGIRTVEEPRFTVLDRVGAVEIREYPKRLAAETTVAGDELGARSAGFRRLAGYIFGANHPQATIEMTAPVTQHPAEPRTVPMTAPVGQQPAAGGGWVIRFWMPGDRPANSLPSPDDPSIRLVTVPAETYAVLRFSGVASPGAVRTEEARLGRTLDGSRWSPHGTAFAWFYDPPWTLPPLRRNEVAVAVMRR